MVSYNLQIENKLVFVICRYVLNFLHDMGMNIVSHLLYCFASFCCNGVSCVREKSFVGSVAGGV